MNTAPLCYSVGVPRLKWPLPLPPPGGGLLKATTGWEAETGCVLHDRPCSRARAPPINRAVVMYQPIPTDTINNSIAETFDLLFLPFDLEVGEGEKEDGSKVSVGIEGEGNTFAAFVECPLTVDNWVSD